jgi:hypothetical protein
MAAGMIHSAARIADWLEALRQQASDTRSKSANEPEFDTYAA